VKRALAALALLAAAPAWAQSSTPQPQTQAAERRAPSKLNLDLNESDLRALSRGGAELRDPPAEQASGGGLPTLGGDARPMERVKPSLPGNSGAYPVDSERSNR